MFQLLSGEESNGIDDEDEVEKKNSTQATDCEQTKACCSQELTVKETSEEMQPAQDDKLAQTFDTKGAETIGDKLALIETSEQMQPARDEELAQTFGTEGEKTIGDTLAESNGTTDKEEVEKKHSTPSSDSEDSEVTQASFLFQLCPK